MGTCQSKIVAGPNAIDGVSSKEGDPKHRLGLSMKLTPGGKNNSSGHHSKYDLELVSPSEKTDLTEALSPTYMISPTPFVRKKKDAKAFSFVGVDNDVGFPSDEEYEEKRPIEGVIVNKCTREAYSLGSSKERNSVDDNDYCDDDNGGFQYDLLSKTLEDNINEKNMATLQHRITSNLEQRNSPAFARKEDNDLSFESDFDSDCPVPSQSADPGNGAMLIQSIIQSIHEVNGNQVENETSSCDGDHINAFHVRKPDVPALLAPPKDVTVVVDTPSNDTAINPATIAIFNKMKSQANSDHRLKKQRRYEEKVEDRRRDIRGYNELWGEYNEIQERVMKQRQIDANLPTPKTGGDTMPTNDSTSWLVDLYTLNSMNRFNHQGVRKNLGNIDQEDARSRTNLSVLKLPKSHAQKNTLQHKVSQQQSYMRENVLQGEQDFSHMLGNVECKRPVNDHENREHNNINNKSIIVDTNGSIVSDLDNGSNSSLISDSERGIDNDDYGVLRRYSRKSIESSVPACTHTEDFHAKFGVKNLADAHAFFSAETPRKTNTKSISFPRYLEENCLPSVSIENAETGMIRWREFSQNEKKMDVNRQIDVHEDKHKSAENRIGENYTHDYGIDLKLPRKTGRTNGYPPHKKTLHHSLKQVLEIEKESSLNPTISTRNESKTQIRSTCRVPNVTNGEMQVIDMEGENQLRLVREVGPQLNDLLIQLKDNGLGEKST